MNHGSYLSELFLAGGCGTSAAAQDGFHEASNKAQKSEKVSFPIKQTSKYYTV